MKTVVTVRNDIENKRDGMFQESCADKIFCSSCTGWRGACDAICDNDFTLMKRRQIFRRAANQRPVAAGQEGDHKILAPQRHKERKGKNPVGGCDQTVHTFCFSS
jgi:hypothetical protein